MTTFVLVHGAWHGGWCWGRVSPHLRAAGHTVFTPTLTGLSDRAHLVSPSVNLSTHVEDIVRMLDAEDLTDVVLVGHSYAGMVISGVAEQRPERLRLRVHLDGFLPENGEAAIDILPDVPASHYREAVKGPGFGWMIPPRSLEKLGVTDQADIDWLTPRLTPQPSGTYWEKIVLTEASESVAGVYIECVDWMRVFTRFAERAAVKGWPTYELATCHEAMVTAPNALTQMLLEIETKH
jgi:pimeloyl-ACP methyl ester carboxylesterase